MKSGNLTSNYTTKVKPFFGLQKYFNKFCKYFQNTSAKKGDEFRFLLLAEEKSLQNRVIIIKSWLKKVIFATYLNIV